MATMNVLDADGGTVAIEKPLAPGRAAATASRPVALSTEDLAVLSSIDTKLTTVPVSPGASSATGGISSTSRILSAAASTNATSVKASAGRVYAIQGYNASASVRYVKLYNKASAPTVGTDTPVKTLAIPPGSGFAFDWPHGYSFATGIALALATGSADADTGALTAGDILGLNVDYV